MKNTMFFLEKTYKLAFSSKDDKIIQWTDSIETNKHGNSKDLVRKEEEIKCNAVIKKYKTI